MPQLAPNFWATNFVTMWLLLLAMTMAVISLQLPSTPEPSPEQAQQTTPQWPWI